MRVHYLQHVPFEGIGAIEDWVWARGHVLTGTQLFRLERDTSVGAAAETAAASGLTDPSHSAALPSPDEFDFLVIMGGPMNIHQYAKYPWLGLEKAVIKAAIDEGKAVLGICLGAQLVADTLGASVTRNVHREIGWFPVELTEAGRSLPVFAGLPVRFPALHWHGDIFAIPDRAVHTASSAACANQAFSFADGRVIGLQFHLEETRGSLSLLVDYAAHELVVSDAEPWIQSASALLAKDAPFEPCKDLLFSLLDGMVEAAG